MGKNSVILAPSFLLTVLTVYPPRLSVSQLQDDELSLPNATVSSSLDLSPDQIAHIMCWETAFLHSDNAVGALQIPSVPTIPTWLESHSLPL